MESIKAIKVRLFLETANFKLPTSFLLHETYPLPPFSTVVGMVHAACGFDEYHDMKICIQGESSGIYTEASKTYSFSPGKYEKDRKKNYTGGIYQAKNGRSTGVYCGLGHSEIISNLFITLYIVPKDEDFDTVLSGLNHPQVFPALGRHDDIVRIDSIDVVSLEKLTINSDPDSDEDKPTASMDMYADGADCASASNVGGTIYSLHKEYAIEDGKRRWKDTYKVSLLRKGAKINELNGSCEYMRDGNSLVCLF